MVVSHHIDSVKTKVVVTMNNKLVFEANNNIYELIDKKDIFGTEFILIIENNNYIGYINKYTVDEIYKTKYRLISGWSFNQLSVYT